MTWPPASLPVLLPTTPRFTHFYARCSEGLLDVRTAPIQPDADLELVAPPRGFLVVAKLWDPHFLDRLGALTDTKVGLVSAERPAPGDDSAGDEGLHLARAMPGWDGAPAAYLDVRHARYPLYVLFYVLVNYLPELLHGALAAGDCENDYGDVGLREQEKV